MATDLCPECGASWDCEHRPQKEMRYVDDPYGPPVAVGEKAVEPSRAELEDRILAAVAERPGSRREELARRCEQAMHGMPSDLFKATLLRLKHDRMVVEALHGGVYLFTVQLHTADLTQRVEAEKRAVEWAEREVATAEKRVGRRKTALAKLEAELAKLKS